MSVRYFVMLPAIGEDPAEPLELTDRVWTALEWHSAAEEFRALQTEWVIEDPLGDLTNVYHWRRVYVLDDEAPEDFQVIGMGFIASIKIRRSEVYAPTANSRAWHLTITDLNYMLSYPRFEASDDMDRTEEETDLARIAAYLATGEAAHFNATDYIAASGGVSLDPNDFTGRPPLEVMHDAMEASGRNGFVLYDETKGGPDFVVAEDGELQIFYASPESSLWESDLKISNAIADIDIETPTLANRVLPPLDGHELHLDGGHIYAKLHCEFDGGTTTVEDSDIAALYTWREGSSYMPKVTSQAKAEARGEAQLEAGRWPAPVLSVGVSVGADMVNRCHAGQTMQVRMTHLGGLGYMGQPDWSQSNGVRHRTLDRSVREVAPGRYEVTYEAVPAEDPDPPTIECGPSWTDSLAHGKSAAGWADFGDGGAGITTAANVVDGTSSFSQYNSQVLSAGTFNRGWQVDLGAISLVAHITMVHDGPPFPSGRPNSVAYSENGADWTTLDEVYVTPDSPKLWDGGIGDVQFTWTPGSPVTARYVRVYEHFVHAGGFKSGMTLAEILVCGEVA